MTASLPVPLGHILAEKYEIQSVLGSGGMGVVALARHLKLGELVAIKFLRFEVLEDAEYVARFEREARIAAMFRSEHVARTLDIDYLPNGAPYIVMEYLQGNDLAKRLASQGALPIEEAIDLVLQSCEALAEAHNAGIVHRDLKPANLFVTRKPDNSPCLKILDFGVSKFNATGNTKAALTQTHETLGTPRYMSPEQFRSARSVDARTDIWSLGVTLYELLSGQLPHRSTSLASLCTAILYEAPCPLSTECPQVPPLLIAVVERALAKSPDDRFANVGDFAAALAVFGTNEAQRSLLYIKRVLESNSVISANQAPVPRRQNATRRGTGISMLLLGIAGLAGIAWVATQLPLPPVAPSLPSTPRGIDQKRSRRNLAPPPTDAGSESRRAPIPVFGLRAAPKSGENTTQPRISKIVSKPSRTSSPSRALRSERPSRKTPTTPLKNDVFLHRK